MLLDCDNVPHHVGLTMYQDEHKQRLFVDINNFDLDLKEDSLTMVKEIDFTITLPDWLKNKKVEYQVITPDSQIPAVVLTKNQKNRLDVQLSNLKHYVSILIRSSRR